MRRPLPGTVSLPRLGLPRNLALASLAPARKISSRAGAAEPASPAYVSLPPAGKHLCFAPGRQV